MPYLLLVAAAVTILTLAFGVWPRPARYWALFVAGGMTMLGDVPAALMDLYVFRPGFLPDRRDHYIGCLAAEWIFVPAYLVLFSLAPPRYRPVAGALGALISTLIEALFLNLGVYEQHRWRTWYSTVLFAIVGYLLGMGTNRVERQGFTPFHRALFLLGGLVWLTDLWALVVSSILRLEAGRLGLQPLPESDRLLSTVLLLHIPTVVIGFVLIWRGLVRHRLVLATYAAGAAAWVLFLQSLSIWHERPGWNPVLDGLTAALIAAGIGRLDQWLAERLPSPDGLARLETEPVG